MTLIRHTIRVPVSLDKTLRALAERHGLSVYAVLQRSVKAGVATFANPPPRDTINHELVAELAAVSIRLADVERMLDRALFTACAAYCYARSAASPAQKTDDIITAEITAAYERQVRLSRGKKS